MILVLVGTNPYSFDRLVQAVDDYAKETNEEIFIQLGHTTYIPQYSQYQKFLDKSEIIEKIRAADLVITQGGFGSIADCLKEGKRVVAVPRMPELKESPDRQEELVRELEKMGRIMAVYDIEDLSSVIQQAKHASFAKGSQSRIPGLVDQFIKRYS